MWLKELKRQWQYIRDKSLAPSVGIKIIRIMKVQKQAKNIITCSTASGKTIPPASHYCLSSPRPLTAHYFTNK